MELWIVADEREAGTGGFQWFPERADAEAHYNRVIAASDPNTAVYLVKGELEPRASGNYTDDIDGRLWSVLPNALYTPELELGRYGCFVLTAFHITPQVSK